MDLLVQQLESVASVILVIRRADIPVRGRGCHGGPRPRPRAVVPFHKEKMDGLNVRLYCPGASLPELKQRTSESIRCKLGDVKNIHAHIWSVHKRTRIPCPYLGIDDCDSTFARGDWVSIHIKTLHKQKRFPCPAAEKEVVTLPLLALNSLKYI